MLIQSVTGFMMFDVKAKTRQVRIGSVLVGGGAPISIQTMAKADPADVSTIVAQLKQAKAAGCDIARLAMPNIEAARTIIPIKEQSGLPLVADIHFDYRLAVAAAENGADGLRINPGNLRGKGALEAVVEAAGKYKIPIRVGVNSGSLPKVDARPVEATSQAMVAAAVQMIEPIENLGFRDIKVSLKSHDVTTMVHANKQFASQLDYPLHLGLTEAGPPLSGSVRSVAALSLLLAEGIGDTIRVSLSGDPVVEVRVAKWLLRALGLRSGGVVISCPTCGRTSGQVVELARKVEELIELYDINSTVAVMGCEVNGPGEARAADIGVAFGPRGEGLLFESGKIVCKVKNESLEDVLLERLMSSAKKPKGEPK
jgi:(E)-4-hydroxy-3-methylbut-2-enyl-diphosphate synthase